MIEDNMFINLEEEARIMFEMQHNSLYSDLICNNSTVEKCNPLLQVEAFKSNGQKSKAIMLLQKLAKIKFKKVSKSEILSTYIYFSDFKGAIDRYQSFSEKSFESDKLRLIIEIHLSNSVCGEHICNTNKNKILDLLKIHFDLELFNLLIEYTRVNCKLNSCLGSKCFLDTIDRLKLIILREEYTKNLNFFECSFLKKYFKHYSIDKQRIKCNPWLPLSEIVDYFNNYDDLNLLSHVGERRYLEFLYRDKRLNTIANESVNIIKKFKSKRPCIDFKLFDGLRRIKKKGSKYFQFM